MYYYGARYYDPRISIFVSVDPLAEKTMTPYQYVSNNPIMRIDPTGMNDHDYKLNKDGSMSMIKETTNESHTIYNEDMSKSITIDGSSISHSKRTDLKDSDLSFNFSTFSRNENKEDIRDVYKFSSPESAQSLYDFAAKNTDVEFGIVHGTSFKDNSVSNESYVFTSRFSNTVYNTLFYSLNSPDFFADVYSHSHNGTNISTIPSGYGYNPGMSDYMKPMRSSKGGNDYKNMLQMRKLESFKNTIFEVNEYKRFNKHTIFNEEKAVRHNTPFFYR